MNTKTNASNDSEDDGLVRLFGSTTELPVVRQPLYTMPEQPWNKIWGNLHQGEQPRRFVNPYFTYVVSCVDDDEYQLTHRQERVNYAFGDHGALPDMIAVEGMARIALAWLRKGPTLVHCHVGWNRSGLVLGLAMVMAGVAPEKAIAMMRKKRSTGCLSNHVFANWLKSQGHRVGK